MRGSEGPYRSDRIFLALLERTVKSKQPARGEERDPLELSDVYAVKDVVAIEDFADRSLALHCEELRLVELNTTARDLLSRLNGKDSLQRVATTMAREYNPSVPLILEDFQAVVREMMDLEFVEQVVIR